MPYIPFHELCPSTAIAETRVISLFQAENEFKLPTGNYAFVELFCNECDCKRVFLQVFYNDKIAATIAYGWESLAFYKREFGFYDKASLHLLKGPDLDSLNPQSDLSPGILKMFKQLLLTDKVYMTRIERHYAEFKIKLKSKR
jgi:hypothetical protein